MNPNDVLNTIASAHMAVGLCHLIDEVQKGHKACAIKLLAELAGCDLANAKYAVDRVWKGLQDRSAYKIGLVDGAALLADEIRRQREARARREPHKAEPTVPQLPAPALKVAGD